MSAELIERRLATLQEVNSLGEGLLSDALLGRSRDLVERAGTRLQHGASHTVVALAGATGSGKSSLFNAIAGAQIARSGVRRPTTSTSEAVTFGDPASELLDWLEIPSRHRRDDEALSGLVLLDLPDHDSFAESHRAEVERLVKVVDVFCWVVDPQKYADAALHDGYLKRFGGHGAVTIVVLNQIDRLDEEHRRACIDHLGRLLAQDGLEGVRVLGCSAVTGEGVDALRSELSARVAERRALIRRIEADVDWVSSDLAAAAGGRDPGIVTAGQRDRLAASLAEVVGANGVAAAAAASYRQRAAATTGWPYSRWVGRLRPDPLKRLGLASREKGATNVEVARTNMSSGGTVARAGVTTAVAEVVNAVSADLPVAWKERLRAAANPDEGDLVNALDLAVGGAKVEPRTPGWWRPVGALQWLLAIVAAAGLVWLAVLFVLEWFKVPDPPTPDWHGWPLPTLMVIGGVVVGLLVAFVTGRIAAAGAARQRHRVRSELEDRTADVGEQFVLAPLNAELERMGALRERIRALGG